MLVVKWADRFIESEIDGEAVLMDLDSGDFFALAGTALAVWQKIDGAASRDAIVAALAAEYGAETDEVASDVDQFLDDLTQLGFLAAA